MKNNNCLEKELATLKIMVSMKLLTIEELKNKLEELKNKYNLDIVLRNNNVSTKTTTINYI